MHIFATSVFKILIKMLISDLLDRHLLRAVVTCQVCSSDGKFDKGCSAFCKIPFEVIQVQSHLYVLRL